jgi:hypothetical protein
VSCEINWKLYRIFNKNVLYSFLLQDSPPSLSRWKALTHILGNGYSQGQYKTAMSAAWLTTHVYVTNEELFNWRFKIFALINSTIFTPESWRAWDVGLLNNLLDVSFNTCAPYMRKSDPNTNAMSLAYLENLMSVHSLTSITIIS